MYPRLSSLISLGVCALLAGALTACGGGGGTKHPAERIVHTSQFAFRAPFDWHTVRNGTEVSVSPKLGAAELVSVSVFRTVKPYRPSLFVKAVPELDRAANDYARRLGGQVKSAATLVVAGERVRQYEVEFKKGGDTLRERITFVFRDRTEYQLLCQWKASDQEPKTCSRLTETFTPG